MPESLAVAVKIDAYVKRKNSKLKEVTDALRMLVRKTVPKMHESINPWGIPTFEWNGTLCYMMLGKHHITFGFPRGASLNDPAKLLEGTGKNLRHVKIKQVEQLRDANLRQLILDAKHLNRIDPLSNPMRYGKKKKSVRKASARDVA